MGNLNNLSWISKRADEKITPLWLLCLPLEYLFPPLSNLSVHTYKLKCHVVFTDKPANELVVSEFQYRMLCKLTYVSIKQGIGDKYLMAIFDQEVYL